MIFIFISLVILISLITIAYPLFRENLNSYKIPYISGKNFEKNTYWLSALSDLEDDFDLGKISSEEYEETKIFLQRRYLDSNEN